MVETRRIEVRRHIIRQLFSLLRNISIVGRRGIQQNYFLVKTETPMFTETKYIN